MDPTIEYSWADSLLLPYKLSDFGAAQTLMAGNFDTPWGKHMYSAILETLNIW